MTVNTAMATANKLRPNTFGERIKAKLLRDLDGQLLEMMSRDYGAVLPAADEWPNGDVWPETDPELLIPAPYDMMYVYYLAAQIDYFNQEAELYANDQTLYDAAKKDAMAWWRRGHKPAYKGNWRTM